MSESYNGYLTKNFSYPEMIKSSTADRLGISNDATRAHVINLVNLCNFLLSTPATDNKVIRKILKSHSTKVVSNKYLNMIQ